MTTSTYTNSKRTCDQSVPQASESPVVPMRIAYMMSRFPKLTETFILYEMIAMQREAVDVELYPLWRERPKSMHPEAAEFVRRAHFRSLLGWRTIAANLRWLCRRPARYLAVLFAGLWANLGSFRYFAGFLAGFPKAIAFGDDMQQRGVAHVHAHFASHPAAAAFVIHHLFGIPYSFTAHGSDLHRDVHMLPEKVRDAAFVVAISRFNRQVIADACGDLAAGKVHVIHCGTDVKLFAPPSQKAAGVDQRLPEVTCVGTLHEVKGQRFLIEACRLLRDRGVSIRVNFVGDGPDASFLQRLVIERGLEEAVRFHGRKTRDEVVALLQRSDIVVAPSVPTRDGRREGIPVVLMEAMACGLPVVASRLSGIPELVQDGVHGRLVPPGDQEQIAAAIQEMIAEPGLRRCWGEAARRRVEQDFEQTRNARRLLDAIRRVSRHRGLVTNCPQVQASATC